MYGLGWICMNIEVLFEIRTFWAWGGLILMIGSFAISLFLIRRSICLKSQIGNRLLKWRHPAFWWAWILTGLYVLGFVIFVYARIMSGKPLQFWEDSGKVLWWFLMGSQFFLAALVSYGAYTNGIFFGLNFIRWDEMKEFENTRPAFDGITVFKKHPQNKVRPVCIGVPDSAKTELLRILKEKGIPEKT